MTTYTPTQARELAATLEADAVVDFYHHKQALCSLTDQVEALTAERDALQADAARLLDAASRLVEHADFRMGGILSANSKSKEIPSNATSQVKARHLASLRDAVAAMKDPK